MRHVAGIHHHHRRTGVRDVRDGPVRKRIKDFIDTSLYFFVGIGIVLTLPQVYKIWVLQNAAGVSLITWSSYFAGGILWAFYGFLHREKPIIVIYLIWTVVYLLIVVGILLYG